MGIRVAPGEKSYPFAFGVSFSAIPTWGTVKPESTIEKAMAHKTTIVDALFMQILLPLDKRANV